MKNLFLILLFVFFSSNSYAAVFDEKSTITEKAQDLVCDCEEGKDKITADTKLKNVEREELDLGVGLMPLDYASSGTDTFTANNFYISGNMNLNKVVYIYSTYSVRSVEHDDIEGTRFARKWQFQYLTAGPGYYIFPTFKIFAGLGKVLAAKNDGGEISYGRIFEKGVIYDIHINNYKIEIGYKFMSVPIDKNKIYSDDMPAKGDCQVFTIGVSSAFSLW